MTNTPYEPQMTDEHYQLRRRIYELKQEVEACKATINTQKADYEKGYADGWADAQKIGVSESHKYQERG